MTPLFLKLKQFPLSPWIFSIPGESRFIPALGLRVRAGMAHTKGRYFLVVITCTESLTPPSMEVFLKERVESP
jgi:hypothetical protein